MTHDAKHRSTRDRCAGIRCQVSKDGDRARRFDETAGAVIVAVRPQGATTPQPPKVLLPAHAERRI
ncbi:hypothetical protein AXA44_08800 [Rhodococcus sp. SC4]|nr:hypothetical protein AXA44_08800 [Rhodococcus sp. SC4]